MKRRSWLWFVASAVLAILAGILAMVFLNRVTPETPVTVTRQDVVIARSPIAANDVIRVDMVTLGQRDRIPSGAAVEVSDVVGGIALRDIAQGEVIRMQDVRIITGTAELTDLLGEDKIAVALPADDILSKWGTVLPGDHVDILVTLDVILEKPMYPEDLRTVEDAELYTLFERDQSMDNVSVLTIQDAEVLLIVQEPQVQTDDEEAPATLPRRAMILKIDPQDAVVLKYLKSTPSGIEIAMRSRENDALFDVQPVNINYLVLRYGIVLPQPLE
jgi:Flp pilus assembly protein CpaB